jgi:hypothetical protein
MTFKHVKFEDSPIMRSLEKVAKEKGLVKPETIQKQASIEKKADYTPSDNLMENILKLCSGLRSKGLVKEASELETNYLNYKQAQTLYETSKETGDDLVEFAHPKGSHKLEGVEGDEATFEDILTVHVKHLEMVAKKPTGKLSNASQIVKEVKRVLGQQQASQGVQQLLREAHALVYQAITFAAKGGGLKATTISYVNGWANEIAAIVKKADQDITTNDTATASGRIEDISKLLQPNLLHNYLPEFINKGISHDDVWAKINSLLTSADQKVNAAQDMIIASITGKQSAQQKNVKASKRALAQHQGYLQLAKKSITDAMIIAEAGDLSEGKLASLRKELKNITDVCSMNSPSIESMREAVAGVNRMDRMLSPSLVERLKPYLPEDPAVKYLGSGLDPAIWPKVSQLLDSTKASINQAIDASAAAVGTMPPANESGAAPTQNFQLKEVTIEDGALGQLYRRLAGLKQKLQSYNLLGPISTNASARKWITDELSSIESLLDRMDKVPENMETQMTELLAPEVIDFEADVADFASQWIQSK